jgi:hypothetical protein
LIFQYIDPANGLLESARRILIRILAKSNMAVTDLDEAEFTFSPGAWPEGARCQDARIHSPNKPGARPGHAFQKTAPPNSVTLLIFVHLV